MIDVPNNDPPDEDYYLDRAKIDYEYNGNIRRILPVDLMERDVVYKGQCRNAKYAYWNGVKFIHLRTKWSETFLEGIHHPENEHHYDVFLVEGKADEDDPEVIRLREAITNMSDSDREYYAKHTDNC